MTHKAPGKSHRKGLILIELTKKFSSQDFSIPTTPEQLVKAVVRDVEIVEV